MEESGRAVTSGDSPDLSLQLRAGAMSSTRCKPLHRSLPAQTSCRSLSDWSAARFSAGSSPLVVKHTAPACRPCGSYGISFVLCVASLVLALSSLCTLFSPPAVSTSPLSSGLFLHAAALHSRTQSIARRVPLPSNPPAVASAVPLSASRLPSYRPPAPEEDPDATSARSPLAAVATGAWWPKRWLLSLKLGPRGDVASEDSDRLASPRSFAAGAAESAKDTAPGIAHDAEETAEKAVDEAGNSLCVVKRRVWTAANRAAQTLAPRSAFAKRLTSALVARLTVQSLLYPVDVVRCRRAQGMAFKDIPVGALYNGCLTLLTLAEVPYCLLCLTLQTQAQKLLAKHAGKLPTVANLFLSAVAADSVGTLYKTPFDCAKGLLQRGKVDSPQEAAREVLKDDAAILRAQYKGFYAQVLRDASYRVLNGQTMQALRRVIAARQQAALQSGDTTAFGAGLVAKVTAKLGLGSEPRGAPTLGERLGGKLNWATDLLLHGVQRQAEGFRNIAAKLTHWRTPGANRQRENELVEQADVAAQRGEGTPPVAATPSGTLRPPSSAPTTLAVGLISGTLTSLFTSPLEAARRYIVARNKDEADDVTATRLQGLLGVCRALYELAQQEGIMSGWLKSAPRRMLVAGPCTALSALIFEGTSRTLNHWFPDVEK
ncbi:carrier superfamily protein [Besnoitia besnoiti]|uniref:Carrier superfamily protein n=1 Tax=Besnoitia besnoiti TaxID=94643 RepID=A0A2A9M7D7_BESBE|nr:carrier superfamily protein [Besnoitia besnoiti]PFH31806.1 carrier superfamily protein [Besnoitia besnoiti]